MGGINIGRVGRGIVGFFDLIIGAIYLIIAFSIRAFFNWISDLLDSIPIGNFNQILEGFYNFTDLIFLIFLLMGLFWIILGIGLFMNQRWAATLTKVMAVISLILSIITCNCIGILIAIIILFLVRGDDYGDEYYRPPKKSKNSRHCPNCGRKISFHAQKCKYCNKHFISYKDESHDSRQMKKTKKTAEEKKRDKESIRKTIYCPECGVEITGRAKFCPECGTKI